MSELAEGTLFDTAELGPLRDALMRYPEDATVRFHFGYLRPTDISSYRGYYDHLALHYSDEDDIGETKVGDIVTWLQDAIGKKFHGWKGGEFEMTESTPVWVSNPGEASSTSVVAVESPYDGLVVICTGYVR